MNKLFKTEGVVIRKIDLNEADKIVTLLTPENGKIHCIAKGCRRIKSRFCGRLELFYRVEIAGFQGRDLGYLNEAEIIDEKTFPYFSIHEHGVLFYIAEITNRLIQDGQQTDGAYSLLLDVIDQCGKKKNHEVVLQAYLIRLLTLLGFMAPWNRCARTDAKLNLEKPLYFSITDGNVIGKSFAGSEDIRVPSPIVKWINFMQQYPFADVMRVTTTVSDRHQVKQLIDAILRNLLNKPLQSERFLEMVK